MFGIMLYIDPGTGAMLVSIILGIITSLSFLINGLFIKLKYSTCSFSYKQSRYQN